ncbi:MAG: imidazoleglycerol-phosphate dehydratase HisB [Eubacteriaceae bacterium]|nr:imidazoleglycerol-phosphate dehydratase HisB [Eubacteriaceae bacterium]
MREIKIKRETGETKIELSLNIDGTGKSRCDTGCGFMNHMLTLFAKHGRFDLDVTCKGDVDVDYHHSIEDIGICLGRAFREALDDKMGIKRYGDIVLPMDETLIMAALDISGRGGAYISLEIPAEKVGDFDTELCKEFYIAFAREAGITLHVKQLAGENSHHIIEGSFKAVARAMRSACSIDVEARDELPSTKGILG